MKKLSFAFLMAFLVAAFSFNAQAGFEDGGDDDNTTCSNDDPGDDDGGEDVDDGDDQSCTTPYYKPPATPSPYDSRPPPTGAPLDGGLLTILGAAGVAYYVTRKKKTRS